ncbi:MAG TPA: acyl-CoA dehydrogenase [Aquabacterium sp.]|nr:acyl-CoA dehydrogenase [Aquabacterium sp.]
MNDDQRMLQDAVQRLVEREYSFAHRRRYAAEPNGWSRKLWAQASEIGLPALLYPAEQGGLGGSAFDAMVVMQALGPAMPLDPWLPTLVLGAAALRRAAPPLQARWVPRIATGDWVLAWAEGGGCRVVADGEGWRLDGRIAHVLHGDSADALLVSAQGDAGPALFVLHAQQPGLTRHATRTHDGRRMATLHFDTVQAQAADVIAPPGEAAALIESVRQAGIAALAAEAVGLMQWLLDTTVAYLKTRQQFGGPIARFQALQHRAAEMLMALELARGMAHYAAVMLDEPDSISRGQVLAAVKLQLTQALRFVAEQAVQLHGGIGVTEENAVGHGLKRAIVMAAEFGRYDEHLALFAQRGGFIEAAA